MSSIPIAPVSGSPRAHELSRRLLEQIEDFRREHPDLSAAEVRLAMRLAATAAGTGGRKAAFIVAAMIAVVLASAALLLRREPAGGSSALQVALVLAIVAAAGLLGFLKSR